MSAVNNCVQSNNYNFTFIIYNSTRVVFLYFWVFEGKIVKICRRLEVARFIKFVALSSIRPFHSILMYKTYFYPIVCSFNSPKMLRPTHSKRATHSRKERIFMFSQTIYFQISYRKATIFNFVTVSLKLFGWFLMWCCLKTLLRYI